MSARLRLRFEHHPSDSTTRLQVEEQQPPLKVVRAFPTTGAETLVHLHNVSGGILAGDQLHFDIAVGPHAKAQITSTGATRVYRSAETSQIAEQGTCIRIEEQGLLEYLPDALIPFAQSNYSQHTRVHLAEGATLFWWEVLAPGRFSSGELFQYHRVHIRTEIHAQDRFVAHENYCLRPDTAASRFGPYTHLVSFYACQAGRDPKSLRALEHALSEIASGLTQPNRILWGVSTLPSDGVAVRGLSATGLELYGHLREFWRAAKLFLTGHEAVYPRKLP